MSEDSEAAVLAHLTTALGELRAAWAAAPGVRDEDAEFVAAAIRSAIKAAEHAQAIIEEPPF